jgi:iron(III) transport system ATP-binding protein
MMTHAVELQSISKTYDGKVYVLNDIHLDFPRGQLTTLLGPSGCGKSTLLRIIAGLDRPDQGMVRLDGKDCTQCSTDQRPIGMVFQSFALFPHMNVRSNVGYGLEGQALSASQKDARVQEMLQVVGMQDWMENYPATLSGGQQQRVALARALATRPQVLLLDEPLSNVDSRARRNIREDIRSLQQDLALTVIYVTHDQAEAMAVSDFVVVMKEGVVLQSGSPRSIYESPRNEYVASFMGDADLFDAYATDQGFIQLGPLQIGPYRAGVTGPVRLVIRPQAWVLDAACADGLPGRIAARSYLGATTEYRVQTMLGNLLVITSKEKNPRTVGAPVSLFLKSSMVSVLSKY